MPRTKHRRSDDEIAFEAFVAAHGDRLLQIATLLTCDAGAAEDVHQETLQRLAARWSKVDEPLGFCRRVMHNLVIDRGRSRARRPKESRLSATLQPGDHRAGDELTAVELRPALLAALARLTPSQRAVVVLRYFDDRSEADVAALLGIATGTVKSTAARALSQLRDEPGLAALFTTTDLPPKGASR